MRKRSIGAGINEGETQMKVDLFQRRKGAPKPQKITYPEHSAGALLQFCEENPSVETKREMVLDFLCNAGEKGWTPRPSRAGEWTPRTDLVEREFDLAMSVLKEFLGSSTHSIDLLYQALVANLISLDPAAPLVWQKSQRRICKIAKCWGIPDPNLAELVCAKLLMSDVTESGWAAFQIALKCTCRQKAERHELEHFRDGFLGSKDDPGRFNEAMSIQRVLARMP